MIKLVFVTALVLSTTVPASAAIYNVDMFGMLPDGVTRGPTGQASTNACSPAICAGGFNTAISFEVQPGDTINFGSLALSPFIFGDGRQRELIGYLDQNGQFQYDFGTPTALYKGSLDVSFQYISFMQLGPNRSAECNAGDPSCIPHLQELANSAPVQQYDLTFTLPDGFIELGWTNPYVYTAPAAPEISTWAMILLGFAFVAWRMRYPATGHSACSTAG